MTYLFSYDRQEAWPLMPDTEFHVYMDVTYKGDVSYKKYNVMMVNPSRVTPNRHLCLCECESMEDAIVELEQFIVNACGGAL